MKSCAPSAGRKPTPRVAHGKLDLTVQAARAERDAAAAHRRHGRERILEQIADHDVHCQWIGEHFESARQVGGDRNALVARALFKLPDHARHRGGKLERLAFEVDAPALEANAVEDLR